MSNVPMFPERHIHREPQDWDMVFMAMAVCMAEKSKDPSTQCGAILVSTNRIVLSTGFNGPPPQIVDTMVPWITRPQKYAYIIHAEENALWFAAGSHGFERMKGSTMYVTHHPCTECLPRMMMCGVKEVVIPHDCKPVPMSKFLVEPQDVLNAQAFPKLNIRRYPNV